MPALAYGMHRKRPADPAHHARQAASPSSTRARLADVSHRVDARPPHQTGGRLSPRATSITTRGSLSFSQSALTPGTSVSFTSSG